MTANKAETLNVSEYTGSSWCRNHRQDVYSFHEYLELIESFHGHAAPGLIIGGKMVDIASNLLPSGILFDAIAETFNCLPDAIQLLTPCTVGNGWLRVLPLGRFALALYDKHSGEGIRVFVDSAKLDSWQEINSWFWGLRHKSEQDSALLSEEIQKAGNAILGFEKVRIRPRFLEKQHLGKKAICPLCGESYPTKHGTICRGCQGDAPYIASDIPPYRLSVSEHENPSLTAIPANQARGRKLLHDMTQIIPGKSKGPVFRKGQIITDADLCRLEQMGRHRVYVEDDRTPGPDWVHENETALCFARAMSGEGVTFAEPPSEGKINLKADMDGLLAVDEQRLEMFNLIPGVMCASRKTFSVVNGGRNIAGTRAIPLFLPRADFENAMRVLEQGPLFRVLPLRKANVGILVTGTEVFRGLVEDRFVPIIRAKAEALGSVVAKSLIVPDEREAIRQGIAELLTAGADLIVTTAGLSVDPDDVTRLGLADAGAEDMIYGAPILPGAMTLLGRIGQARLIGVPACALYFKTTAFDLLLPRLLAGLSVTRQDLAKMGHGAMCLECKTCTFPKCPFGK